jgi:nucleoside-diphosphate-sugar epimerase
LTLFARRPEIVRQWLTSVSLTERCAVAGLDDFDVAQQFDVLINFVGVGNPAQAAIMGASIFDITLNFDKLALDYIARHPDCRYIFLSSGAAYGKNFDEPVGLNTSAMVAINVLEPQDWYGVAKLHAECRHRALPELPIVDLRVFNYFSSTQDMSSRFLISDIFRAIADGSVLQTSADYMVRDYLHPSDFHQLVSAILAAPLSNAAVDCYSMAPIDKPSLLAAMHEQFGLQFATSAANVSVNATGNKPYYYSLNRRAADFGYQPTLTSLECIVQEMRKLLPVTPSHPDVR